MLAAATTTLERVKSLATQVGLKYVELPDAPVGVGIAINFGETQYTVLSVMGGGSEGQLYLTSGVLREVRQDQATALALCNRMVRDNPGYPVYLHEAQVGWDILVSNVFPVGLLFEVPTFFANSVRALPIVADKVRPEFMEASLGGRPFSWSADDLHHLLMVSML